ncbi:MAG: DUF2147 domain-containing protein [Flavobacteriales bacterium]|nr:DUF2147 domain-containing protein [Flavobacteriales bacterium]
MKIKVLFGLFVLLSFFGSNLLAQNEILGYWMDEDQERIIEIYESNEFYHGRIVWLKDSLDIFGQPLRDVMNDDPKLRSRKVLGLDMLTDYRWDDDVWRKGDIYNYRSGNDYSGKMRINEDGDLRLKGYYSLLWFLGRTKTWKRPRDLSIYDLK